jgi:hypothetical protein
VVRGETRVVRGETRVVRGETRWFAAKRNFIHKDYFIDKI